VPKPIQNWILFKKKTNSFNQFRKRTELL